MMMLLAVDTATRYMSLALHDGQRLIADQTWLAGNQHSRSLAPSVQKMMEDCGVSSEALQAVAVTVGPGSYTGVRIGISFAKAVASVRDLPLVGVSSLEVIALAQPFVTSGYPLIVVLQAGRGRIIAQTFHRGKQGRWEAIDEPAITTWEDLLATVEESTYLSGEINQEGWQLVEKAQIHHVPVTVVDGAYRLRRAGFLAEEALRRIRHNDTDSDFHFTNLSPVYISELSLE